MTIYEEEAQLWRSMLKGENRGMIFINEKYFLYLLTHIHSYSIFLLPLSISIHYLLNILQQFKMF